MGSRDNRRICGPEKTVPIAYFRSPESSFSPLDENDCRHDGRATMDLREFYMGVSNISQAKGSSYTEIGETKVICGVYGPRESPPSRGTTFRASGIVNCEIKFAPFSRKIRKSLIPDSHVKELSTQVKEAFEAVIILDEYPKSQIDIYISVIEDGGSVLSACINAASLALSNASIHMYDILVSTSLVWSSGKILLDPTVKEEGHVIEAANDSDSSNGQLTIALMPAYAKGQISLMVQSGAVLPLDILEGLEAALDACRKIYSIVKQVILDNLEEIEIEESKE